MAFRYCDTIKQRKLMKDRIELFKNLMCFCKVFFTCSGNADPQIIRNVIQDLSCVVEKTFGATEVIQCGYEDLSVSF